MTASNGQSPADIRAKLDAMGTQQKPKPQQAKVDRSEQETETLAALVKAQQEAKFWQLKYFELQQHTSQVIAMMSQQTVLTAFADQLKSLGAQQK